VTKMTSTRMKSSARKQAIVERAEPVSEYVSEIANAIHMLADVGARMCDIGEHIADGLFAVAAGMNTDTPASQRNMTAVFKSDSIDRYGDVHKKLDPKDRERLERFIDGICKSKR
jgi:hypothetical protein